MADLWPLLKERIKGIIDGNLQSFPDDFSEADKAEAEKLLDELNKEEQKEK